LILDTLGGVLDLPAGAEGPLVSYLAGAVAPGGLDQFVADVEPQQVSVDVHIAARPGDKPSLITANTA
jgi:hypothetical protein